MQKLFRRSRRLATTLGATVLMATGLAVIAPTAYADDHPIPPTYDISADTNVPYLKMDYNYQYPATQEAIVSHDVDLVSNTPLPAGQATLSNLVFWDNFVAQGSYNGMTIYDITDPAAPVIVSNTICPGYQGDLTKAGDLIFFSVDQPRNGSDCGAPSVAASNTAAWEGIRIFNVADPAAPTYVGNVKTRCGSHTHTLVEDPTDENIVYLYNGSYDTSTTAAYCTNPHLRMEIIRVDITDPSTAAISQEMILWDTDPATELPAAFTTADRVSGGAATNATRGCHDITAYPAKNLLAAACEGDGVLMNIADPANPVVLDRIRDANFAFWHTAQFNNDATKIIFQDELGGGSTATCVPSTQQFRGANGFYTIDADFQLELKSYFKIPRRQAASENCVTHEGNILPIEGRDIFVQAFYQGGMSVIDFTEIEAPKEIAFFDRGPAAGTFGYWATYFKDGYVYGSEIGRGLDVLNLVGEEYDEAKRYRYPNPYNPSSQPEYTWGWKTAPVLPEDLSTLPTATAVPAFVPAGAATPVTVTLPAGTFGPAEYVDIWADGVVLTTGTAGADGSFSGVAEVTVPQSGSASLIVRGDAELDGALHLAKVSTLFSDVPADQQFAQAIYWAAANGVTTGYTDGSFRPTTNVSRQAMVAFLYRSSGATGAACTSAPFADVPVDHPFCKEIAWAASNGITLGTNGLFEPTKPVSRQAAAAFIYRTLNPGVPAPVATAAPFTDVPVGEFFTDFIAWNKSAGIALGNDDGTFGPTVDVSRQAAAAFLYRGFAAS